MDNVSVILSERSESKDLHILMVPRFFGYARNDKTGGFAGDS